MWEEVPNKELDIARQNVLELNANKDKNNNE
jgi:hypothetical protein